MQVYYLNCEADRPYFPSEILVHKNDLFLLKLVNIQRLSEDEKGIICIRLGYETPKNVTFYVNFHIQVGKSLQEVFKVVINSLTDDK